MAVNSDSTLRQIPIERLQRGRYQPRQVFDQESLQALADTMKQVGVIQPLLVRPLPNGCFEIIAGERRWRAAQLAQLHEISCIIRQLTDEQAAKIALLENLNREDLNPIEEAQGIAHIMEEFVYNQEELADVLGVARSQVTNLLRLLKLDQRVQDFLRQKALSEAHGKILAGLPYEQQYYFANLAVQQQWSSRALDKAIKRYLNGNQEASLHKKDVNVLHLERRLSDHFGHPVNLSLEKNNAGAINIQFKNLDHLQAILERLGYRKQEEEFA